MKVDNSCQRACKKPNRVWVSFLFLLSMTLTASVWAQQVSPVARRWQQPVPIDWPNDAATMPSGGPVVAAKLPFRLFEDTRTSIDPFIDTGADAQWQLAQAISPQKSLSKQTNSPQPYPWPQPVDSVVKYGNPPHTATEMTDVVATDPRAEKRPLTKLKLPSLGKGLRLPKLATPKQENAVVPQFTNGSSSGIPLPGGSPRPHLPDLELPQIPQTKLPLADFKDTPQRAVVGIPKAAASSVFGPSVEVPVGPAPNDNQSNVPSVPIWSSVGEGTPPQYSLPSTQDPLTIDATVRNAQPPNFPSVQAPQFAPELTNNIPQVSRPPLNDVPSQQTTSVPVTVPQFGSPKSTSSPTLAKDTKLQSQEANKHSPDSEDRFTNKIAASPEIPSDPRKLSKTDQERASAWGGGEGDISNSISSAAPDYSLSDEPLPNPTLPLVEALKSIHTPNPQNVAVPSTTNFQINSAAADTPKIPAAVTPTTAVTPKTNEKVASIENKPPPVTKDGRHGNFVEATRVLALVGNQSILAGDVLGQVNELLKQYEGKAPQEELDSQRQLLVQQALPSLIDNKLVFLDFLRTIPADKLPELEERVFKLFAETELPKLIEKAEVKSSGELDAKLRELGSSLDKQRRLFMEKSIAGQMVRRGVDLDKEVTHDQMLQHYYEHRSDYEVQARAQWEHLMTRFDKFDTSRDPQTGKIISPRQAAWTTLAGMGNEILRGAPSQAVARRSSQGPRAKDGGVHDWTTKGSLVSDALDQALFTMPTGRWSRIFEDDDGFHIVRVVKREPAGKVPFIDVQDKIRESIQRKRFNEGVSQYLAGLRESTYVWTAFEGELNGARAQIASPLTSPDSTLR